MPGPCEVILTSYLVQLRRLLVLPRCKGILSPGASIGRICRHRRDTALTVLHRVLSSVEPASESHAILEEELEALVRAPGAVARPRLGVGSHRWTELVTRRASIEVTAKADD